MTSWEPTEEQKEVIGYPDSLVVIAKPGGGKTFVLSEKIRIVLPNLPAYRGVIAISYTNKASDELKRRSARNGIDIKSSFFGTIDRFCDSEIIIPFLAQLWGSVQKEIVIRRIRDLEEEEQEKFSDITVNQISIGWLSEHLYDLQRYFQDGLLLLETNGALALYTLLNSVACQRYIKARYSHVFIDEYQDSGLEQHGLFLELSKLGLTAVAVGDAHQSIFGFSGKDSRYLLELAKRNDFKMFAVTFNHRCHPSIINYSQRLLNASSSLLSASEMRVFEKSCPGGPNAIANWIDRGLPKINRDYAVSKNSDIGILVRVGSTGDIVNDFLKTKHRYFSSIPLEEHFSLWAHLFCQLLRFRFDNSITAQAIIESSTAILTSEEIRSMRSLISQVRTIREEDLSDAVVAVANLLLPNATSEEAVDILKQTIQNGLLLNFEPANDDEVQIMTLHKAKGLEFDIVFHLDLYEWVLPAKRPGPGNDFDNPIFPSMDQDINLHYVGVTRARKACFLCTSTERVNASGETRNGRPSEFLILQQLELLKKRLL